MQIETKYLRLRKPVEIGQEISGWHVCWLGGWDIPERVQRELGVGQDEEVIFTQITASAYSYRDTVHFRNGREILLQALSEGQRVRVLDLSLAEAIKPFREENVLLSPRRR